MPIEALSSNPWMHVTLIYVDLETHINIKYRDSSKGMKIQWDESKEIEKKEISVQPQINTENFKKIATFQKII